MVDSDNQGEERAYKMTIDWKLSSIFKLLNCIVYYHILSNIHWKNILWAHFQLDVK